MTYDTWHIFRGRSMGSGSVCSTAVAHVVTTYGGPSGADRWDPDLDDLYDLLIAYVAG